MTIHGTYAVVPLTMGRMTRTAFEDAYEQLHRIFSVSAFTKHYLQSRAPQLFAHAKLEEKIMVVTNAIDSSTVLRVTQQHSPSNRIISVSGVKRKKGYLQAVAACKILAAKGIAFHYDIYGSLTTDPAFVKELQQAIDGAGLASQVSLHGSVSDDALDTAYRAADVFLLPSLHDRDYFEGFGLVFLEANARGTPVVGPNTGGCPEAIEEGKSGFVVDPEVAEQIADRLERILVKHAIKREDCIAWAKAHDIRTSATIILRAYALR
jgi:glycosyltransferase involved in cell wall biosynthesis